MSNRQPAIQRSDLGPTVEEPTQRLGLGAFVLSCTLCGVLGLVALAAIAQFLIQVWHPLV